MLHENCTGKKQGPGESWGSVQIKIRMEQPASKYATGNRGGNEHSSSRQPLEWVQFPDCHAGVRMGTALPWRAGNVPPLGQGLSLLHWNHPSSVTQPRGTRGGDSQPQHGDPGSCRCTGKGRKPRGASSPGQHTQPGGHTEHPGRRARAQAVPWGMNLQSATGPWNQIECTGYITANSSPAARAGPSLQRDSNIQTLYNRLLPFSHGGKEKPKLKQQ